MKRADHRSVGELLLECDLTARRMLIDPDVLDPAAMVRVWPEVVQAAHELGVSDGLCKCGVCDLKEIHCEHDPAEEEGRAGARGSSVTA